MHGARGGDEFRFHVDGSSAAFCPQPIALGNGIEDLRHGHEFAQEKSFVSEIEMRRLQKLGARKILREKQMADLQFLLDRASESGADEILELLPAQERLNLRATTSLADSGVQHRHRLSMNPAADAFNAFA